MTTIFRFKKSQSAAFVTDTDHFDDPLSVTILPPKDESPQDCELRLRNEQEADRISREIDDSLRESRSTHEKRKKAIKVLLLGESVVFAVTSSWAAFDAVLQVKRNRERVQH